MRGSKRERRPGVWELRVYTGRDPVTGAEQRRSVTFHGTSRQADTELARLVADAASLAPGSDAPLSYLLDAWLELIEPDRSPTTLREYKRLVKTRIVPALGSQPVGKVTPATLDAFYRTLSTDLAAGSIRQVHSIIRRAFVQAVKWGWVDQNPAARATPPAQTRPEIDAPPLDIALEVISRSGIWRPMFTVAAATGLRRGELCGLQWQDIDGQTLRIRRAVVDVAGRLVVKEPKTRQRRTLALDPTTRTVLEDLRAQRDEVAGVAGCTIAPTGFVFSQWPDATKPPRPEQVSRAWATACRTANVTGVRLHDLRHLHATQLLAAGVPVTTVAARLGHAQTSTTLNVYGHALDAQDEAAARLFAELVERASRGTS